jgi:hypothetical protein
LCRTSGLRGRYRKNRTRRRADWKDGARFPNRSLSRRLWSKGVGGWNKRHGRCSGIRASGNVCSGFPKRSSLIENLERDGDSTIGAL